MQSIPYLGFVIVKTALVMHGEVSCVHSKLEQTLGIKDLHMSGVTEASIPSRKPQDPELIHSLTQKSVRRGSGANYAQPKSDPHAMQGTGRQWQIIRPRAINPKP